MTAPPTAPEIRSWLIDMDGVLVHEETAIPGAAAFLARLAELGMGFMVMTNNSIYTPRDLAARLQVSGLDVPEANIWTSALATARFMRKQRPGGTAFVIGETRTYRFERVTRAVRLVAAGARFIATNPDPTGPTADGPVPATGAVTALISRATGVQPYFVGKPNPLMVRSALNALDAHSETAAIIGDRMDTDIKSGLEAGMHTVLVLTGSTAAADVDRYPFRPSRVVDSIADLVDDLG
jgi:NagD protein